MATFITNINFSQRGMGRAVFECLIVWVVLTVNGLVASADSKDDVIKKDHKLIEGTWIVVALEANGNKAMDEDAKKLKVIIGADGSWSLDVDGKEVAQGTSVIDSTKTPKTIDFTTTVGEDAGKQSFGIYEVSDKSLKFCVAQSGMVRPSNFAAMPGSEHIFVTFERENVKQSV